MRIAIVGAGAVGGYFGGRLAEAGEEVVFIARGKTLAALRDRGLEIESPLGDLRLAEVTATEDPVAAGPVDAVIVAVKAWQVTEAAPGLSPLLGPGTSVLPLQNGVEAADELAAVVGESHVLGAVCKIICEAVEPGRVRHHGAQPYVALGELDNRPSERLELLRRALDRAGVRAEVPSDVRAAIWEKFLFITAVSGLGAITRSPLGVLLADPQTRRMLEQAMREVAVVAGGLGVRLAPDAVERTMAFAASLPENATASMQRDLMEGRPSELEAQNGAVVRLGRQAGVATPLNHFIYHCLSPMERRARAPVWS